MKTIDMDDADSGDGPSGTGWPPKREFGSGLDPKKALGILGIIFAGLAVLILGSSGNLGFVKVSDSEVAVKVDYISGDKTVIETPGIKIYIPFLQEIFILDQTPQRYVMEGREMRGDSIAPYLTVRASDGSNFSFESLEIQYKIIPAMADTVLEDSGIADGFKRDWIRAYGRSILRDEFGRLSAVEVADPSSYRSARIQSTVRLNDFLKPHGIQVMEIITPKPRFDKKYEDAIAERKVADQEVERLKVKEAQLIQERAQKLARVSKEKEIEWQGLQGDLTRKKLEAEQEAIRITKGADRYKVTREAEGQQTLDRQLADAKGLRVKYTKEAEGITARTKALEMQGRVVVREAIINKLSNIRFTLVPYSRDAMPQRLEHSGAGTEALLSGSNNGGN
jgi:regulator of protease activity HflC (stomatin/prohibitin superfamily)